MFSFQQKFVRHTGKYSQFKEKQKPSETVAKKDQMQTCQIKTLKHCIKYAQRTKESHGESQERNV